MKSILIILLLPLFTFGQEQGDFDYVFKHLDSAIARPDQVYHLDLSKQKLQNIPEEIFLFNNLLSLNLSRNKISLIPAGIRNLTRLEILDLSKNSITILPPQLFELSQLKELHLSKNSIEAIPPEIEGLKSVIKIDLWQNEIKSIAENIANCSQLEILDVRGMIIPDELQKTLNELLPKATIHYSNACDCKN